MNDSMKENYSIGERWDILGFRDMLASQWLQYFREGHYDYLIASY